MVFRILVAARGLAPRRRFKKRLARRIDLFCDEHAALCVRRRDDQAPDASPCRAPETAPDSERPRETIRAHWRMTERFFGRERMIGAFEAMEISFHISGNHV